MTSRLPDQAIVLVGGKGTRLGDLTRLTPKPLMPIAGDTCFLDVLLRNLARQGVRDIVLLAGHFGDQVRDRYADQWVGAAHVSVSVEPEPAGTGGALTHVAGRLDDRFLMLNGDSLFDFDLAKLEAAFRPDDLGALAVRRVENGSRYGTVRMHEARVRAFCEKDPTQRGSALISGGVYLLSRDIVDRIARLPCSLETDVFPALADEDRLGAVEADGYFLDIGLPDTLEQARRELLDAVRRPAVVFQANGIEDLIASAQLIGEVNVRGDYAVAALAQERLDIVALDVLREALYKQGAHLDEVTLDATGAVERALQDLDVRSFLLRNLRNHDAKNRA